MKKKSTDESKDYIIYTLVIILILNMPIMLLLNSFRFTAFDFNWYEKEFTKAGSYEFGYAKETIDSAAKYLIDYLKYDDSNNPPKIEIYGSDENIHLLEVKTIMQKALFVADLTLFVFIIGNLGIFVMVLLKDGPMKKYTNKRYLAYLCKSLMYGGIFTIALIGFILLSLKLNFSSTFAIFHQILSFGQWQFPSASNMIRMFPGEFFYDIGTRIFLWTIYLTTTIIIAVVIARRKLKLKNTKHLA